MSYKFHGPVSSETMVRNVEYAKGLGLPYTSFASRGRLAVIGGSPSLANHLQELRDFDGDRWIVASAFAYCRDHGIDGAVFNIDPQPVKNMDFEGAKSAILASCNDRSMFEQLENIQLFDLFSTEERTNHGPSTVTAAPELAITMGYKHVVFYGCDGSSDGHSHPYKDVDDPFKMRVLCGSIVYDTNPEWLAQSDYLSAMIKRLPQFFSSRSEGLLNAMIENDDYDITEVAKPLLDILEFKQAA